MRQHPIGDIQHRPQTVHMPQVVVIAYPETEDTHTAGAMGSDFQAWNESQTPLGRVGQVQDIAPIVSHLASSDAGWVTGEIILGSGGMR